MQGQRNNNPSLLRGLRGLCVLCGFLPALAATVGLGAEAKPDAAARYLYLPPDLAGSVVFYHSFSRGAAKPEINLLGAKLGGVKGRLAPALTGNGLAAVKGGRGVALSGLKLPLTRPVTVSLWFRLDEPMKAETGFHLLALYTRRGYISNFVRGKGTWCALREPTFVVQLYGFAGISNVNGIYSGNAWLVERKWHHAAAVVSEGSRVRVFWNARLRSDITARGRLFNAGDVVANMAIGPSWLSHPMTIDEVVLLDRALSPAEVRAYVTAVRKLAEAGFPFR